VSLLQQRLKAKVLTTKWSMPRSVATPVPEARRLPALLAEHKPEVVVLELGGNDGLRGSRPRNCNKILPR
jgi:acyl-CoA thioesterase-1